MDSAISDPKVILAITGAVVALGYVVARQPFGHDPREPPLAPQSIPLIGHIIGLSKRSYNYHVDLSQKATAPIFTLPLPGQKMYVVTTPDLIQKAQKQHRKLAFPPIEVKFAALIYGASPEARALMNYNLHGDEGNVGIFMESHDAMNYALRPGAGLDGINRAMVKEIARVVDLLQPPKGESREIGLNAWLKDSMTMATTRSVYGPMNPFNDREIVDAFWEFEKGLMSILINFLPSITAKKAVAARTKVADAFKAYYQAGGEGKASAYARNRYKACAKNGLSLMDNARLEIGGSVALLVNTVPAAFWTFFLFHSHPGLLEELRTEIGSCVESTTTCGRTVKTLDITALKHKCPLLLSAYQEVLRYGAMGTSVREVMEDTYLDQWLLKKGAMLQMPSRVIHQDTSLWGPNAADFHPRRFLPEEKGNRPRDVCFRTFGGGKSLCPGRHFATNEVLAVVAVMIARFNVKPVAGEWKAPTTANTNVAAVIMEPDYDVQVEISTREGHEDTEWVVKYNEAGKTFALVTEGRDEAA